VNVADALAKGISRLGEFSTSQGVTMKYDAL